MATTRFTRARLTSVNSNGGTYTHDYSIASGKELNVRELFASSDTDGIKVELLYSADNGSTWTNPFDTGSNHLLVVYLAGYIPVAGNPEDTWYVGGSNILIRVKITNNHPSQTANVFYLVKGLEKDV